MSNAAKIAELQKQKLNTNGHTKRAYIQKQIDALTELLSPRQRTIALQAEFDKMCKQFAKDHGLVSSNIKARYNVHGPFSLTLGVTFGDGAEVGEGDAVMTAAMADKLARNLAPNASLGLLDFIQEQAARGQLYKFSEQSFGPVTGWNSRAPKSPLQYKQISSNGNPVDERSYKCGYQGLFGLGVRADCVASLEVMKGDLCYVDYQPEVEGDPDDQPGFYSAHIVSLEKEHAIVKYLNGVEGSVVFSQLITAVRFI